MGKLRPHLLAEGPTLRPLRVTSALLGAPYPGWLGRSTVPRSLWFLEALCFLEPPHPVASSGPGTQPLRSVPALSCENTAAATGGLLGCGSAGRHGAGTPVGRRVSRYRALAPSVPLGILITDRGALLSRWHGRVFKGPQHSGLLWLGAAPAQGRCLGMGRGWERPGASKVVSPSGRCRSVSLRRGTDHVLDLVWLPHPRPLAGSLAHEALEPSIDSRRKRTQSPDGCVRSLPPWDHRADQE